MAFRLGVDVGGTFTDFALFDTEIGAISIHKVLTTPSDPSLAVLEGAIGLLRREGIALDRVQTLVHGTTLVTNATIERRGARTGMLVTAGFRDVLDIGKEQRYDLFDLRICFPEPLVPRHLRYEIDERTHYDGRIERSLRLDQVRAAVEELATEHGIEALAVCFLHSYVNPAHEKLVGALLAETFPELYVSLSSDVSPFMREYERWTTTTVNAYAQPMVDRYLGRLVDRLRDRGFRGRLYVMNSSGGTAAPGAARRFPVRLIESGPAAGALMCAHLSLHRLGAPNVLSFDMGGTTTKGALIRDHKPLRKYELEVARVHAFKKGSGLPLRIPAVDLIEIGSGGGGVAAIDQRGLVQVGPQSAGADPGPACYGLGGSAATLTDANLVLGYLDPDFFLGGDLRLDRAAAERAIRASVALALDLEVERAAWGVHETINEDVARAFRVHAAERGFDYRGCGMIAFGGSGPIHALRIARKLQVPRVVFPAGAGVMSAIGLLVSPLSHEIVRSDRLFLDELDRPGFAQRLASLSEDAAAFLREAGVPDVDISITHRLDMRYQGQGYEIEVELPSDLGPDEAIGRLPALFARRYEAIFSLSFIHQPLEIVNWKVEARGPRPSVGVEGAYRVAGALAGGDRPARKGSRRAYFPELGGYVECAVYDRYGLRPGQAIQGPALVEEKESTCLIGVSDTAVVDDHANLIARVGGLSGEKRP